MDHAARQSCICLREANWYSVPSAHMKYRLTSVETVYEEGSWLFTVRDGNGEKTEVILVPCEDSEVQAWVNRCTHEDQRLHREDVGVVMRDSHIVCPKHGSTFDTCLGDCDTGPAAETTLWSVEIAVENEAVYLTDSDVRFLHRGAPTDGDNDEPSSTSHLRF